MIKFLATTAMFFLLCLPLFSQNEIEIVKMELQEVSPSVFSLSYRINNSFYSDSYADIDLLLPFEKNIIQGSIKSGLLSEKDILFSQTDIDLNNNSNINDNYKIRITKNSLIIDNKNISPLIKTGSNHQALIPRDDKGALNINRIGKKGKPFTLRNVSPSHDITIGLNPDGEIEFRKLKNSILFIEIITAKEGEITVEGEKPHRGLTNEKALTDGETLYRYYTAKNITPADNTALGKITIEKITRPFTARITYYFSLTENLVLMKQKILRAE